MAARPSTPPQQGHATPHKSPLTPEQVRRIVRPPPFLSTPFRKSLGSLSIPYRKRTGSKQKPSVPNARPKPLPPAPPTARPQATSRARSVLTPLYRQPPLLPPTVTLVKPPPTAPAVMGAPRPNPTPTSRPPASSQSTSTTTSAR